MRTSSEPRRPQPPVIQTPLVRVVRDFACSPERVFDAWIDPALLGRFLFAGGEIVRIETHPVEGGHYSFVTADDDGERAVELNHFGRYLRVQRPRKLIFTWRVEVSGTDLPAPDSEILLELEPLPGGCRLTLLHELHPDRADAVPGMEAAWEARLGRLVELIQLN